MADTSEYIIEGLVIAILQASDDLSGVTIVHYDSNAEPFERIGVKVDPKIPIVPARDTTIPARVWQSVLTIYAERLASAGVAAFETWRKAIDDAIMTTGGSGEYLQPGGSFTYLRPGGVSTYLRPSSGYPAQVIADATAAFPNGLDIDIATGGELQPPQSDYRTLTRTFRVKWIE